MAKPKDLESLARKLRKGTHTSGSHSGGSHDKRGDDIVAYVDTRHAGRWVAACRTCNHEYVPIEMLTIGTKTIDPSTHRVRVVDAIEKRGKSTIGVKYEDRGYAAWSPGDLVRVK